MDWQDSASRMVDYRLQQGERGRVGPALKEALDGMRKRFDTRTSEATKSRQAAEAAVYDAYPEAAAARAGITLPQGEGADTSGMRRTKVTRGGTTYEAPDVLDETGIAKIYTDYVMKIQAANANPTMRLSGQTPLIVPTMVQFVKQYFPEYLDQIRSTGGGTNANTGDKIKVRRKSDGKVGSIVPSDFSSAKYEKL